MTLSELWTNPATSVLLGADRDAPQRLQLRKRPGNTFTLVDLRQLVAAADDLGLPSWTLIVLQRNRISVAAPSEAATWTLRHVRNVVADADRGQLDGALPITTNTIPGIRILKGDKA